jgi:hypothetical protein
MHAINLGSADFICDHLWDYFTEDSANPNADLQGKLFAIPNSKSKMRDCRAALHGRTKS